jgi:predicted dehydrogenase
VNPPGEKRRINVAYLATSHPHFEGRAESLAKIEGVSCAGVFDRDRARAERAASRYGGRVALPDEILKDPAVDYVVIEGENGENLDLALRCAAARKPFLVDKPGAPDLAGVRRLAAAVREAGVFAQVGYHMRYSPAFAPVERIVREGLLGPISLARFHASTPAGALRDFWFTRPEDMGGLVFLDACHVLDWAITLLGPPASVRAEIAKYDDGGHLFEDAAAVLMRFGERTLATLGLTGWEANGWVETWDMAFFGTEGTLYAGIHPPWFRLYMKEARGGFLRGWNEFSEPTFPGERNYLLEQEDVIDRLRRGEAAPRVSADHAVAVVESIDAIYRSAGGAPR